MSISRKKALIAKGIEQAWHRRFSYNVHSGVRVKIRQNVSSSTDLMQQKNHYQSKSSSFDQTDRMQSRLKHLWIESETSALCQNGQNSITITNSSLERTRNPSPDLSLTTYSAKPTFSYSFPKENYSRDLNTYNNCLQPASSIQKNIGIQTTMITRIDRQTSCDIIMPTSMIIQKSHKSRSSSSSSSSKISVTEDTEGSTETSSASTSTTTRSEANDNYARYRRNKNRNNNAVNNDIERKDNHIENSIISLPNIGLPLQDTNIKTQCYTQPTGKRGFFGTFLNLFSFLRFSSFKRDRVSTTIGSQLLTNANHNEWNKNTRPSTSRCRRSAARNDNHSSSIQPEKHSFQLRLEEDPSSKANPLEEKLSVHSVSDISISTRKQYQQTNNSSLSIIVPKTISHRSKKHSRKRHQRKISHRKENGVIRDHDRQCLHRKKRNHIHQSKSSSHSQQKILSTTTAIQPEESVQSSICNPYSPNHDCPSLHENVKPSSLILSSIETNALQKELLPLQQQDLPLKSIDHLLTKAISFNTSPSSFQIIQTEDKQYISPTIDSIHLRVKHKNLISNSQIPLSSIDHVDNSIKRHEMNIINEFKSILQQTKNIHINNNALDDDSTALKTDTKDILNSSKSTFQPIFFSMKNQNQHTSIVSSDSQSISTENNPINKPSQNEIVKEGVDQLLRYQNLAERYKLKSNKAVNQFLMKSIALSPESLYKLSINNEPNSTYKINKNTK